MDIEVLGRLRDLNKMENGQGWMFKKYANPLADLGYLSILEDSPETPSCVVLITDSGRDFVKQNPE